MARLISAREERTLNTAVSEHGCLLLHLHQPSSSAQRPHSRAAGARARSTATAAALNTPPLPYTSAARARDSCRPAASRRSCSTASATAYMAGTSHGAP